MALPTVNLVGNAPITPSAMAAPAASETIPDAGADVWVYLDIGVTATTITVTRNGTLPSGDDLDDLVIGPLTSTRRWIRLGEAAFRDADGEAAVGFDNVTNVTGTIVRFG